MPSWNCVGAPLVVHPRKERDGVGEGRCDRMARGPRLGRRNLEAIGDDIGDPVRRAPLVPASARQVPQTGRFRFPDPVLDAGVLAVAQLQPGGLAGMVPEPVSVRIAVTLIPSQSGKVNSAPGWGRSLRRLNRDPCSQPLKPNSPVASATHAPSRISTSVWIAGAQQDSGIRSTTSLIRASTGKPKEKPTPRSRQAAANAWVAPAESERASTRTESGCHPGASGQPSAGSPGPCPTRRSGPRRCWIRRCLDAAARPTLPPLRCRDGPGTPAADGTRRPSSRSRRRSPSRCARS